MESINCYENVESYTSFLPLWPSLKGIYLCIKLFKIIFCEPESFADKEKLKRMKRIPVTL